MKRNAQKLVTTLSLALLFPIANFANDKESKLQSIEMKQDVPLGITYYYPTNVPAVSADGIRSKFKFFPYLGQKADGKPIFGVVISTMCFGYCGSLLAHESMVTVDGHYQFVVHENALNHVNGSWTSTETSGDSVEEMVRGVAAGKDAWLIVVIPQGQNLVRANIHLTPEQFETFRLVVEKADSLNSKPQTPVAAVPAASVPTPPVASAQPSPQTPSPTPAAAPTPAQATQAAPEPTSLGDVARQYKAKKAQEQSQQAAQTPDKPNQP